MSTRKRLAAAIKKLQRTEDVRNESHKEALAIAQEALAEFGLTRREVMQKAGFRISTFSNWSSNNNKARTESLVAVLQTILRMGGK